MFINSTMLAEIQQDQILKECTYQTSRSGGKGGQNVNKVETKVEIAFDFEQSFVLTRLQKDMILAKSNRVINGSVLKVSAAKHRTQLANKQEAQDKLIRHLQSLLKPRIKRLATKPTKASKQRKLNDKKALSEKKSMRRKES